MYGGKRRIFFLMMKGLVEPSCFASTREQATACSLARTVANLAKADRNGVGHGVSFDINVRQLFGFDYAEKLGPLPASQQPGLFIPFISGTAEQRSFL
jgi:hypothetical protein